VIPGEARLSLDIRHGDDATRGRLRDHLEAQTHGIAESRGCGYEWQPRQETPAVPTGPRLSATLERAVENSGVAVHRLPSGAGHDAAQLAALAPVAMLFVRCKDGISHNPEESVKEEDVGVAIDVLGEFLRLLAGEQPTLVREVGV